MTACNAWAMVTVSRSSMIRPIVKTLGWIVGLTEIVDCVRPHCSKWYAAGHYAFILANSRPLPFIRWKGALSLRSAPDELLKLCGISGATTSDAPAATAA